jgi:outer membrane protein TolC
MKCGTALTTVVLCLSVGRPLLASRTLTLRQALTLARRSGLGIVTAGAVVDEMTAAVTARREQYLPTLSLLANSSGGYATYPLEPGPPPIRVYSANVTTSLSASLNYPVYDFAYRAFLLQAALSDERAADARLIDDRQRASISAAQAYILLVRDSGVEAYLERSLLRRQQRRDVVRALADSGQRPATDGARADLDIRAATFALGAARAQTARQMAILSTCLGLDPTSQLDVASPDSSDLHLGKSQSDIVTLITERSPVVRFHLYAVAAALSRSEAAARRKLPTFGLRVDGYLSSNNVLSGYGLNGATVIGTAGAYLSWTLDPALWGAHRTFEAQESVERSEMHDAVRSETALVVQLLNELSADDALIDEATELASSSASLRDAQAVRYEAGLTSLLEVITAMAAEDEANLQVLTLTAIRDSARVDLKISLEEL